MRDPAEVSGPGRFSRRRGRGPFVNYLLDNILPKVPLGRSRLPCKSPLHTRGFQVENVGFSGADGTQPPCPSAMDAAATFPGKERKVTELNAALCSRLGDTRARVKGGVSPTAIPCTTLGPPEILTPLPASVWVQTGPVSLLAFYIPSGLRTQQVRCNFDCSQPN